MSEQLPRISYVTLMHGFLNLSFLTMCATIVINLVVGALDQAGKGRAWRSHRSPLSMGIPARILRTPPRHVRGGDPVLLAMDLSACYRELQSSEMVFVRSCEHQY